MMGGFPATRGRGAALLTLIGLVALRCLTPSLEQGEVSMETLACALDLIPAGGGEVGLVFTVRNSGDRPVAVRYFDPYADFDLTAEAADGDVSIVQPAYNVVVEPVSLTLGPGESARIATPIRLRFDPDVGPAGGDVPTRWSLRHQPAPVLLRATPQLNGATVGSCETRWDPRQTR